MRKSKFIASVIAASTQDTPALPFQRGTRRAAMIARRQESRQPASRKTA